MQKPEIPLNEEERTRAIQHLGLIYSPSEARFDRITRLACRHFDVSTALVSLVYKEIQWFKSTQGLNACSTDREISFCGHAILNDDALVIENALLDSRFMDNPLVVDGPKIRFYAGQPIRDSFGVKIGTLCLIDGTPRQFTLADRQDLRDFARLLEEEIAKPADRSVVSQFIQSLPEHQRQLLIDPRIGSWNRRGFEAILEKEIEHAGKQGKDLCLMHARINAFDQVISRFGPDRVHDFSKFVASILRDNLPTGSSIGSLSMEAFVAVYSDMTRAEVHRIVKQIQDSYAQTTLETHGVKVLVDVAIKYITLSGTELQCTPEQALTALLNHH